MRRAMRAWPVREGCFAFDNSSRMRSAGRRKRAATPAASPNNNAVSCMPTPFTFFTTGALQARDSPRFDAAHFRAGGHQLPADQPDPAATADALHGLVQQDRASAGALALHRGLAIVRGPGPGRGEEAAVLQP